MNSFGAFSLRPRWILLILLLAGAASLAWLGSSSEPASLGPGSRAQASSVQVTDMQVELRNRFEQAKRARAPKISPQEEARQFIDKFRAAISADPAADDTPALLNAMGNLYREKLVDYASAAEAYQRLIIDYPEWVGNYAVYTQLESCYEALKDDNSLRWLYTLMMQRFPPENDLHRYAAMQLHLPVPAIGASQENNS